MNDNNRDDWRSQRQPKHKRLPTITHLKTFVFIVFVLIVLYAIFSLAAPAASKQPFDHSGCQYPARTTNPADGCDNSDPAIPYCAVKGLPEKCTQTPTSQIKPTSQNVFLYTIGDKPVEREV